MENLIKKEMVWNCKITPEIHDAFRRVEIKNQGYCEKDVFNASKINSYYSDFVKFSEDIMSVLEKMKGEYIAKFL